MGNRTIGELWKEHEEPSKIEPMTIRPIAFLVSPQFVAVLNSVVLIFCTLSVVGLLPFSAGAGLTARAIPAIPPLLTCLFLLIWRSSVLLATLALVANLLELALGLAMQLIALQNAYPPELVIPPSMQEVTQRYLIVFASVVVPLFSVAALASHKPVSSGGFFARPIAAFWLTTFITFLVIGFLLGLFGAASMGHGGTGGADNFLGEILLACLGLALAASFTVTALVSIIMSLFRRSP